MLTVRGSFLICVATFGMSCGILFQRESVVWLCLAVLLWVWLQWLAMEYLRRSSRDFRASITRHINGESDPRVSLVAERDYEIEIEFDINRLAAGYRIVLQDTVPDGFSVTGQSFAILESNPQRYFLATFSSGQQSTVRLRYSVSSPVCGRFIFTGIKLEISDTVGLFRSQYFIPIRQTITSLPYLVKPQTTVSVLKHNNLQQHLGHHRHRSTGISSELHGIRDYRPGDPPRSISWKATGKLGRLMTSEYENEVPIRATLLVDLAAYQFTGRPAATAGDRAISASASIARLLLADRDPVAAVLINELATARIKHGNGELHLTKLLQRLIQAATPSPPLMHYAFRDLIQVVFEHATLRFPDLVDEKYNHGRLPLALTRLFTAEEDYFRRPLAVLLAHLFQLPHGTATRLQYDNAGMRDLCLRYANEYAIDSASTTLTINPPLRDFGSWLNLRSQIWLELCERLNEMRSRARENELFVIISPEPHDMLSCEMMVTAIRSTVAAKHRVVFIAPEPPAFPDAFSDSVADEVFRRHQRDSYRTAESDLGSRLQKIGVPFARIDDPKITGIVAAEVGVLQSGAGRAGARTGRARR